MFVSVVASITFFLFLLITSIFLLSNCYVKLVLIDLVECLLALKLHHTLRLRTIVIGFIRLGFFSLLRSSIISRTHIRTWFVIIVEGFLRNGVCTWPLNYNCLPLGLLGIFSRIRGILSLFNTTFFFIFGLWQVSLRHSKNWGRLFFRAFVDFLRWSCDGDTIICYGIDCFFIYNGLLVIIINFDKASLVFIFFLLIGNLLSLLIILAPLLLEK